MSLSMLMPMLLILMLMIPMTSRLLLTTGFRVIFSFNLTTWLFKRTYISRFWPSHDKPIFNFKIIKRILNSGLTFFSNFVAFPATPFSCDHSFIVSTRPFFRNHPAKKKTLPSPLFYRFARLNTSPIIKLRTKTFEHRLSPFCYLHHSCSSSNNSLRGTHPLQSTPSPNILVRSPSAHSNSVLTFPNNIYRHTCYCSSSVSV